MKYSVECFGWLFTTHNKYAYEEAMNLEDTEKNSLNNPRLRFLINMSDSTFNMSNPNITERKVYYTDSFKDMLHVLNKSLSYDDHEEIDNIIGNDPYTPLY